MQATQSKCTRWLRFNRAFEGEVARVVLMEWKDAVKRKMAREKKIQGLFFFSLRRKVLERDLSYSGWSIYCY